MTNQNEKKTVFSRKQANNEIQFRWHLKGDFSRENRALFIQKLQMLNIVKLETENQFQILIWFKNRDEK